MQFYDEFLADLRSSTNKHMVTPTLPDSPVSVPESPDPQWPDFPIPLPDPAPPTTPDPAAPPSPYDPTDPAIPEPQPFLMTAFFPHSIITSFSHL
jgi:hypothetical protein